MFKTALRLGPKIKLVSQSRRRHYNQASEVQAQYSFNKYRHKHKCYVESPITMPVSMGCEVFYIPMPELTLEPLSKPPQLLPSTCQLRALRAIDWLYGEQWQAGLLELDETSEL